MVLADLSQGQIALLVILALSGVIITGLALVFDNGGDGWWNFPDF